MTAPEHSHFEELAALLAGGHLSLAELNEFREHAHTCPECQQSAADFANIVHFGLPLTAPPISYFSESERSQPEEGVRKRFLQRATSKGCKLSEECERPRHVRKERCD